MIGLPAEIKRRSWIAESRPMADKYKLSREERRALLRESEKIYKSGDEFEFMHVLRRCGVKDEDPRFAEALKRFREMPSGKP